MLRYSTHAAVVKGQETKQLPTAMCVQQTQGGYISEGQHELMLLPFPLREKAHAGRKETSAPFKVPKEAIGCGFHDAVRGVLSHHVVIRDGKIANYHPYPPTSWNASPRDTFGVPGPYEDAVVNTPLFEENTGSAFKGIDIMRAVRSFDPCLPCGVHIFDGDAKLLELRHSPTFGVNRA